MANSRFLTNCYLESADFDRVSAKNTAPKSILASRRCAKCSIGVQQSRAPAMHGPQRSTQRQLDRLAWRSRHIDSENARTPKTEVLLKNK
jgi:hypothetical protein